MTSPRWLSRTPASGEKFVSRQERHRELEAWVPILLLSLSSYVTWTHPIALVSPTFFIKWRLYAWLPLRKNRICGLEEQVGSWVGVGPATRIGAPRAKRKCRAPYSKLTKKLRQWLGSVTRGEASFWVWGPVWWHGHHEAGGLRGLPYLQKELCLCVSVERILIKGQLSSRQVLRFRLDPYYPSKRDRGVKSVPQGGFAPGRTLLKLRASLVICVTSSSHKESRTERAMGCVPVTEEEKKS